jgi:shikimate kinase
LSKSAQLKPNLYLVGFMGVGKSAIGRRVARELDFTFIDSDHQIEKEQGKPIPKIFEERGETYFRKLERDFIEKGHPSNACVVSCGGGLVIQPGMKDLLKQKGIVICLFASAETIIERTSRNNNRPLLNVPDPAAKVRALLAEREPVYMDSGSCITTEGRTIPEVVNHMIRSYKSNIRSFRKQQTK